VAERLIVFGFFEDAIDRLAFGSGTERLRAAVARKFDARRCCHPDAADGGQEKPPTDSEDGGQEKPPNG
jgi:hypothetical protein